jgi:oxygen-independent coproporphyrinogen-3 oxidase
VTVEANPGPRERGDPAALLAAGVTRLSIGAQSLDDGELRGLGRRHRATDVAAAVREARAAGIPDISLDLLYDLPGQTIAAWRRTLEGALALEPDHLSLYALTLDDPAAEGLAGPIGDHLPTSAGARRWRAAARLAQDDDRAAEMYELADRRLAEAGYAWYEISNWARPGHRSRHNLGYWRRRPYEAVGPGAHAFDGRTRRWNAAPLGAYLDALAPLVGSAGALPPGGQEVIDDELAGAEAAILALRTADGSRALPDDVDVPWLVDRLAMPLAAGLVERTADGRHVLTMRGRLLSNEVFALLLPAAAVR